MKSTRCLTRAVLATALLLALAQAASAISTTEGAFIETNGHRIHTFTSSGTFMVLADGNVEVLVSARKSISKGHDHHNC